MGWKGQDSTILSVTHNTCSTYSSVKCLGCFDMTAFQTMKTLSYSSWFTCRQNDSGSSNHHSQDWVSNPLTVDGKKDPFA